MANKFIRTWLDAETPNGSPKNLVVLTERPKKRAIVRRAIQSALLDHFVGVTIIEEIGGFTKAGKVIRNALPVGKIARSGEFGEVVATEYVSQMTEYTVPIKRLRYKDDRNMAMRGDDLLGFEFTVTPPRVLKAEAKSRAKLTKTVVKEACDSLCRHQGRPNPSTLSFISRRLREQGNHKLARQIEELQERDIPLRSISHLIFTLSGNDPSGALSSRAESPYKSIRRKLVGCHVADHTAFIESIFEAALKGDADGVD